MDLHGKIMNIPAKVPKDYDQGDYALAYKTGHRDARHAAAELACTDRQADDAHRYSLVRKLTPQAFAELYAANQETGKPFDELLDDLEPFLTPNAEVSMARGKWRGHEIAFVQGTWIYTDTGLPVSDEPGRKCGHCGADNCDDECDPCLGNLPGVMNACCGHGDRDSSYIQFSSGVIVRGFAIDD